jgi:hypothetical protein
MRYGKRCLGSLFGDVESMAASISIAREARDVTVWLNAKTEIVCSDAGTAPELPADHLLGTYGVGAEITDIRQDLLEFRNQRSSNAILF